MYQVILRRGERCAIYSCPPRALTMRLLQDLAVSLCGFAIGEENSSFYVIDITGFNENTLILKLRFFAEVIKNLARRIIIL